MFIYPYINMDHAYYPYYSYMYTCEVLPLGKVFFHVNLNTSQERLT